MRWKRVFSGELNNPLGLVAHWLSDTEAQGLAHGADRRGKKANNGTSFFPLTLTFQQEPPFFSNFLVHLLNVSALHVHTSSFLKQSFFIRISEHFVPVIFCFFFSLFNFTKLEATCLNREEKIC